METANKLYLFSPEKSWEYCGGGIIICAADLEEAVRIGNANPDKSHCGVGIIVPVKEGDGKGDRPHWWVFTDEFVLAEPYKKGVLFSSWNYA